MSFFIAMMIGIAIVFAILFVLILLQKRKNKKNNISSDSGEKASSKRTLMTGIVVLGTLVLALILILTLEPTWREVIFWAGIGLLGATACALAAKFLWGKNVLGWKLLAGIGLLLILVQWGPAWTFLTSVTDVSGRELLRWSNDLRADNHCPPAPSVRAPARTLEKGEMRVMTSSARWSSWHNLRTEHRIKGLEWQWRYEGLCIAVRMRGGNVRVIERKPGSTTPHIPNGSAYAYASMHASRMELTINVVDALP